MDNKNPTHKVTNVEIIADKEGDTFGVKFAFDDGDEEYAFSDSREEAEWDATDRIGEEMPIGMNPKLRSANRMQKPKDERAGIETSAGPYPDMNDGKPWSEADLDDLKRSVTHGTSLKATADFLCRSGTVSEVAAKARELGLTWAAETKTPDKQRSNKTDE
jgi:hypothetical protein